MKILEVESGSIQFNNKTISNFATYAMTSFGIGYMPEDRRLIPNLVSKRKHIVTFMV